MPKQIAGLTLYSTPEAAKLLSVTTKTLRGYIKVGRIAAVKYGRSWHIAEANLRSFLEGGLSSARITAVQADVKTSTRTTRPKRKAKAKRSGKGKR